MRIARCLPTAVCPQGAGGLVPVPVLVLVLIVILVLVLVLILVLVLVLVVVLVLKEGFSMISSLRNESPGVA